MKRLLLFALWPLLLPAAPLPVDQAELVLEFKPTQLQLNQVSLQWGQAQSAARGYQAWQVLSRKGATLEIRYQQGKFQGLGAGRIPLQGPLVFRIGGETLSLPQIFLQAGSEEASLQFVDAQGQVWLLAEGFHHYLRPGEQSLMLDAMSIYAGEALLRQVGMSATSSWFLGRAIVQMHLIQPKRMVQGALCANPNWDNGSNYYTDVALIDMPGVQQVELGQPWVTVAPDAELRNVGTADVPWFRKFSTPDTGTYPPPYNRDQHPLLTWNMYRIDPPGILLQIGRGEVKHAFNTINDDCSCNSGGSAYDGPWNAANPSGFYASILWSANHPDNTANIGCRDIYAAGTNDHGGYLGLRAEVPAYTVAWEQCGSLFAPAATPGDTPCDQVPFSQYEAPPGERRMVIDEAELSVANARYLVEAWYLIRDDINIFNTMGHVDVAPYKDGSIWQFPESNFAQGSILDAWVDPASPGMEGSSDTYDNGQGHAGLAVKVLPLGNGVFRWVLALVNHDYDPALQSLSFSIDPGLNVLQTGFHDLDADAANDWQFSQNGTTLSWQAPAGNPLNWGNLYTLWFDMEAGPLPSRPMTSVDVLPVNAGDTAFAFTALKPAQQVFADGSESP